MAVISDDFATDPATRWTGVDSAPFTWDSTNFEFVVDLTVSNPIAYRYTSSAPGSIEHECQVTFRLGTSSSEEGTGGPGVRMDSGGAEDYYGVNVNWRAGEIVIIRSVGGTATDVGLPLTGLTLADGDWITIRLAAAGTAGNNVVLSLWYAVDSGAGAKPNYTSMIGVDGSPNATRTDSDVDRLDAAGHAHVGIVSGAQGNQYDTMHDNWRAQAISDRGGGGGRTTKNTRSAPLGVEVGMGWRAA